MTKVLKVTKTRRTFWVLSTVYNRGGEIHSKILATCKTKREATKLRGQNKEFEYALINSVNLYQN